MIGDEGVRDAGIAILVACALVGALVPGAATVGADPGIAAQAASGASPNDTTTRHVRPGKVNERGDVGGVRDRLARQLAGRLANSSIRLSRGQYEAARDAVDREYRRELGRYVDVAGNTEAGSDDRTGERLGRAREDQRAFASTVEAYRSTYEEYERARRNGNTTGARRLARRLDRLAERAGETGRNLTRSYRTLSNTTGVNLTDAAGTVRNTSRDIAARQAAVREETFVETTLTARVGSGRISFLDPLVAAGRVTAANGTPVRNGTVRVAGAGRTVGTTTNATGYFTLRYRPVLLSLDATAVTLRYVPENASAYLGAGDRVDVSVEQVRPTVRLVRPPGQVGFGENVTAVGTVAVDGIPVASAPVVLAVGDRRLGRAETAAGWFAVGGRLPADVPPGERRVRVSIPVRNRAIAPATAVGSATVTETGTSLTLDAAGSGNRTVRVTGRLTTAGGAPVAGRPVSILVDGSVVGTVRTTATGGYDGTVTVPPSAVSGGTGNATAAVTAAFDGGGTNLAGSRTGPDAVTVRGTGGAGALGFGVPAWVWLGGLLAALAVGLFAIRRRGPSVDGATAGAGGGGTTDGTGGRAPSDGAGGGSEALLALARRRAAAGEHDDAVRAGYEALRRRIGETVDLHVRPGDTHWEFYRACRDADVLGDRIDTDTIRYVTEQYELAVFAAAPVSAARARDVIEDVQRLIGHESPRDGSPATGDD